MKQTLLQLIIFYHVVDQMSFSKAAQRLNLSKAYVSNQISDLEKTMHLKLLERNTRRLELTFAGEQVFQHSRSLVKEFNETTQTMAGLRDKPEGLLRITAPTGYAAHILAPNIPVFLDQYPEIRLDLKLTGEVLDFTKHKIDVAIRLTHKPPEDKIAKRIGTYQLQVCASAEYLKNHGEPKHPPELSNHACLVYSTEVESERWPFVIDKKESYIFVKPRLACNTYEAILSSVLNGQGIARLPSYVIDQAVKNTQLKLLFANYMPPEIPIYAIYAQTIYTPPMVRAFIEFLGKI